MNTRTIAKAAAIALLLGAAALSACVDARGKLSPDFGAALRQDLAAQIDNPDAAYAKAPPPHDGERSALAMERYQTGKVIPPSATASSVGAPATGGGGMPK